MVSKFTKKTTGDILYPASSLTQVLELGPKVMKSGNGYYIKDADGHELLDGIAGLWCVNIGYGRRELGEVMAEGASQMGYYHSFTGMSNEPQIELAKKLVSMAPGKLSKVFFGTSGSDANDTLMKIIWHYNYLKGTPKKKKLIARQNAYHGTSISSASLTGIPSFHKGYNLPIKEVIHTDNPHYYRYHLEGETESEFSKRKAKALETLILTEGPDTVAAFFAEPIMGAGGVIDHPEGYFEEVHKVLKKYDILMVADEVITGYGRLGSMFASDQFGIKPDLLATAKGLTSGYFPLSAAFITEEIWDVLKGGSETLGAFSHGYTYSGHPIGAMVALKNLEIIEKEGLVENAKEMGDYLHKKLHETFDDHPHIGEIRGRGLLAALQLIANKNEKAFFDPKHKVPHQISGKAYELGLITRPLPSVTSLALSPPLMIDKKGIDLIVEKLEAAINQITKRLSKEELAGI